MDRRLKLHKLLEEIPGVKEVYFQPPGSVQMIYPCIRYKKGRPSTDRADNRLYRFAQGYELMVLETDPDSPIAKYIVENFQMAEINTVFVSNNLYHTSITLYF